MDNKNRNDNKNTSPKKKITSKQVVAMGGIILLVLLYIITLIVAFVDNSASGKMFALCLFASIAIPFLIWIYVWMYGKLTNKRTFADFDAGVENSNEE